MALAVAEPDASAWPNMMWLAPVPTVDRLMEVVAHCVGIGEVLEVGNIAFLNVVKTHRRGALSRGDGSG